ncbi:MAG: TRIC cation channel family protein [Bifidobacterium sp.]|nr:TRIC cation channel family protein [Bifidobacterium sp.]
MEIALQTSPFFQAVEYLAIFCCGMVGGLAAIRKHYDVFTIIITAWLTALGGGIIRDLLLGAVPPVGISDRFSVLTALAAGVAVAIFHPEVDRLKWSMLTIDALALGLFAVNGTSKSLMYNTSGMTAVFLGTFTAMGGGLIRDILLNEVPVVIRDRHWYIMPAVIGSMLTVVVWRWQAHELISLQVEMVLDVVIVLLVVAMRLCSVILDWQLPGAVPRHRSHLPNLKVRRVHHRDGTHTIQEAGGAGRDGAARAETAAPDAVAAGEPTDDDE